jgi:hypothetical protein
VDFYVRRTQLYEYENFFQSDFLKSTSFKNVKSTYFTCDNANFINFFMAITRTFLYKDHNF